MIGNPTGHQAPASRMPFILLASFLVILLIAGGASRTDVLGQAAVRAAAIAILAILAVRSERPDLRSVWPAVAVLGGAVALAIIQLVPLPASVWSGLPGHSILLEASRSIGEPQPWRPISISPDATRNALFSLLVPIVVVILMAFRRGDNDRKLLLIMLGLCVVSAVLAVFQFTGGFFDNPFLNDQAGQIGGSFANPNHLALFAAIGCFITPLASTRLAKQPVAVIGWWLGLTSLLVSAILASGSRAGLVLGALAIGLGLLSVRDKVTQIRQSLPGKWSIGLAAVGALLLAAVVGASVVMQRATAVGRIQASETLDDGRIEIWSTVVEMIAHYFPFGSGLGSFDNAYRIAEPYANLGTKYINQAHNDVLQVILDGGAIGLVLLVGTIVWWARMSWLAWRVGGDRNARLGSGILLLVILASIPDYPARTPMIMAVCAIAGSWLARAKNARLRTKAV